uniref:Uncharacterized protein n=1 Tax=Anguilla anguilla TaxID=7936 RepID=A0A0E9WEM9_ANGAN
MGFSASDTLAAVCRQGFPFPGYPVLCFCDANRDVITLFIFSTFVHLADCISNICMCAY